MRDSIIEKIRKCFALSTSPEPAEAAAALEMALKLMKKYKVSRTDLNMADVAERRGRQYRQKHPPAWTQYLANEIGAAFGAEIIIHTELGFGNSATYVFIGIEPNLKVAEFLFTVLVRRCTAARKNHLAKLRGKRANRTHKADIYAMGWVASVSLKLQEYASKPVPGIVKTYIAEKHKNLEKIANRKKSGRVSRSEGDRHFTEGWFAGREEELHRAVVTAETRGALDGK